MVNILTLLVPHLLRWQSRPSQIRAELDHYFYPVAPATATVPAQSLHVGIAQMRFSLHTSALDYANQVRLLTSAAVERGAQLVVFPEDTGTPLLGLLPRLAASVKALAAGDGAGAEMDDLDEVVGRMMPGLKVADLFRAVALAAWRVYNTTFSYLAAMCRVHILAGSILLPARDGRLYNVAHLYGPDGRLLGRQAKTHLFTWEHDWGLGVGAGLRLWDALGTRFAVPICMDQTYWEPARLATAAGAEILISPAANSGEYDEWLERRGGWGRAQEAQAYCIFAAMVGDLGGVPFSGCSAVYAPLELTPDGTGLMAIARHPDRQEVLVADLDLAALRDFRAVQPRRFNSSLYKRYLPMAYDEGLEFTTETRRHSE